MSGLKFASGLEVSHMAHRVREAVKLLQFLEDDSSVHLSQVSHQVTSVVVVFFLNSGV